MGREGEPGTGGALAAHTGWVSYFTDTEGNLFNALQSQLH